MKCTQITPSFATCKSPQLRQPPLAAHLPPVSLPTLPPLRAGRWRYLSLRTGWQSKACPDTQPLCSQELHQEGKEQIFQLCLSSLHFKGCAWVWERIQRVCQSTCKTPHSFAPTVRLSLRTRIRVPTCPFPLSKYQSRSVTQAPFLFHPICQTIYTYFKIHIFKNELPSALKEGGHPKQAMLLPWGKRAEEQLV